MNFKFILYSRLLAYTALTVSFSGCATAPVSQPAQQFPLATEGFFHRVQRGQTLWRISKMYAVDLDEIIKANRITDVTKIETDKLVFIPGRRRESPALAGNVALEDFIWPLKGEVIATFGQTSNSVVNKGLNISPRSQAQVVAARSGRVVFYSENLQGFGKTVILEHPDNLSTVYARNSKVFVRVGENVSRGARIAEAGSAGRDENIYLHFEIRKRHIPRNPYFYLAH